ncbi:MAG TPA: hypothetical protein VIC54_01135 [Terriglobales bacterium]
MNIDQSSTRPAATLCMAQLFKTAFDGGDLKPLRAVLAARLAAAPADAGTRMNLCVVDQLLGDPAGGLQRQGEALRLQRLYQPSWPASRQALRVLALMAPGGVGDNMPIEFLLEDRDVALVALYLVPGEAIPAKLPDHDVAIVAADMSDANRLLLEQIESRAPAWPRPLLNRSSRLPLLMRERMFHALAGIPGVVMPPTLRVPRAALEQLAGGVAAGALGPGMALPLIARPVGSHGGRGLVRFDTAADVAAGLAAEPAAEFYLSPFIDYSGPGGVYRKYRIMMVDGQAYPCHMAIGGEWKLWYHNADMAASAEKRAEEDAFMTGFEGGFGRRHGAALAAMAERIGLEYWGIDCAETAAGELLLFEGSTCLAAHAMDSPQMFPYKRPAMRRLFAAFEAMLRRQSGVPAASAARCATL